MTRISKKQIARIEEAVISELWNAMDDSECDAMEHALVSTGRRKKCPTCGWVGMPEDATCGNGHPWDREVEEEE